MKKMSEQTLKDICAGYHIKPKQEIQDLVELAYILSADEKIIKEIKSNIKEIKEKISNKPIYKDDGTGDHYYYCGNCNARVPLCSNLIDQIKYKYCPYCGEEIDWSDEDDK